MAGGQWEVVGGKAKKTKAIKVPKKVEKSNGISNFAVAGPIAESKTIFNTFLEKKEQVSKQPKSIEAPKCKEKINLKKKSDKKNAVSKMSFEDLFSSITEEEVKNHIATLEVLLPNSPLLWLKDLVTFFNLKLDISIDAATLTSKPTGYPCTLFKKSVYAEILKTFKRCNSQTLQIFYEFCLNGLVQDGLKGLHILGYCAILQGLTQEMPSVASSNIFKCAELCRSHSNRQNICLLLWWVAGQVGNKDLETGFKIWLQLMFPMIGEKNCSSYAIEYLEELVNKVKSSDFKKNIIEVRDFFPILDFVHSKELPKNIQKRLLAVYPTLKVLSYGQKPENIMRNYFPSYLHRLEMHCPQPLKSEILSSLVYCLEKDSQCFSVWRQLYTKHFAQSKLLTAYLNDNWKPPKFSRKCLSDTLSVFQVTNEELVNSTKNSTEIEECLLINKELLLKLNASKFSWIRAVALLLLITSLLLTYDIMTHNSFTESNIGIFMKDTGLLVICTQAGEKFLYFYQKIQKLVKTYNPIIIAWFKTSIWPFVELFLKGLLSILTNMWKSTLSIRIWCNEHFPPILEQMENEFPSIKENIYLLLQNISVQVVRCVTLAWESAISIAVSFQSNENLMFLIEMTKEQAASAVQRLRHIATYLYG